MEYQDDWQEHARRLAGPTLIVFVVLCLAFFGSQCFYTVQENEKAVVLRFGTYHSTKDPGFHTALPFIDEVLKVNVTEERRIRLPIGGTSERMANMSEEETLMLTGDLNAASVEWTVQWKIKDPEKVLFRFAPPPGMDEDAYLERVVTMASRTVMNRLVGDYSIDEVLTEKRSEIRVAAREATQKILNRYECGVAITDLQMQRVRPPAKVRPAFDAVNSAIQEQDKLEKEANQERNKLIPAAQAERDKKMREAEGYASRRRSEVEGEIEALRAKYAAYSQAPNVTRKRMYLDAMEEVLEDVNEKIILDSDLKQVVPLLPLREGGVR
ncbi:FtsH protease activity modulator HflK [Thalassoroseus pseudoceratinae]|uniref:FtsH protease activity modulator HflK n=1 Tax=Thalassoroseus pseudoceratinae TaxID=2713176 RepID=UPI001423E4CE|nr:FtsH protease activity modulator HflK [Thalassoroseus pseudoceratinae]